jgi:redox-sensing transcriptional repressor
MAYCPITMEEQPHRRVPDATVARLPVYLRCLHSLQQQDVETVSSERLADLAGVNAAKVRKDLSYLGSYGTRGIGYDVEYLVYQVSRELGLTQQWPAVIVGVGNLGRALADYAGFNERGFPVVALVDSDPAKAGVKVAGMPIRPLAELSELVSEHGISVGIVATPPDAAQAVTDLLVDAGVGAILNFAPTVLSVPADVSLRKVDLAVELQILSFHQQRIHGGPPPASSEPPRRGDGQEAEASNGRSAPAGRASAPRR